MIHMSGIQRRSAVRAAGFTRCGGALFHREYRELSALRKVSFDVPDGALVGMIGPNGAGKSTCVKVMYGILVPSSGTCEIMGYVRGATGEVRRTPGVFGQRTQLVDVPVRDSFELLRDIYRVPEDRHRRTRSVTRTFRPRRPARPAAQAALARTADGKSSRRACCMRRRYFSTSRRSA